MIVVKHWRTIEEAVQNKPWHETYRSFRWRWVGHLYVAWVRLFGPGCDYERARVEQAEKEVQP